MLEIKEYINRIPVINWMSQKSRSIWENKFGPMEESNRRQIKRDEEEDKRRKEDVAKHAKTKNPGLQSQQNKVKQDKKIAGSNPHSHEALNAKKIGKQSKYHTKSGFYVQGTKEFDELKIEYGFLVNEKTICINGNSYLMNGKSKKINHGNDTIQVSLCGQSVKHALTCKKGKRKELIAQNVSIYHIATGQAILVALIYDGTYKGKDGEILDKYKLQSIYEANDATTLALAGALDNLIIGSKTNDYQEDIFDRGEIEPSIVLDKSPLENVVYLLANPDLLRKQIRTIVGGDVDLMKLPTIIDTYDSEMPWHIDRQSYQLLEHLETPDGATKLKKWLEMNPTSMSIDDYREWLFTPDGEHMLSQFWKFIDDDSFLIESDTNDEQLVGHDLYNLITSCDQSAYTTHDQSAYTTRDQSAYTTRDQSAYTTRDQSAYTTRDQPVFTTRYRDPGYGFGGAAFLEGEHVFSDRLSPTTITTNFESYLPDEMCLMGKKPDSRKSSRKKK
jgi:hypothetical protein